MTAPTQPKTDRLNLRLSPDVKHRVEKAASLEGKTVSRYIEDIIARMSVETINQYETISEYETMALNRKDAERFLEALSKPVIFNNYLQEALQQHSEKVNSK